MDLFALARRWETKIPFSKKSFSNDGQWPPTPPIDRFNNGRRGSIEQTNLAITTARSKRQNRMFTRAAVSRFAAASRSRVASIRSVAVGDLWQYHDGFLFPRRFVLYCLYLINSFSDKILTLCCLLDLLQI